MSLRSRRHSFTLSLLLAFPPASLHAIDSAWEKYRQGEFDSAIKGLQQLQKTAKTREDRLMALYGEAHVWNYRSKGRNPNTARAIFGKLQSNAPREHPLVAWAEFELAQADHVNQPADHRDNQRHVRDYFAVFQRYPDTDAGQEAWIHGMTLKVAALAPDIETTLAEINDFLDNHPSTPWRSQCHSLLATLYKRQGHPRKQIEQLILSSRTRGTNAIPRSSDDSGLCYQIAAIAEFQLGDFALAREYCHLFLKEYPRDNRTFTVNQALQRMDRLEREIRAGRTNPPGPDLK